MTVTDHRPTVEVDAETWEQTQADLASLRSGASTAAELERLREQNRLLREVNVKLGRVEAENQRLQRTVSVLVGERDTARAEITEARNRIAGIRETNRRLSAKWTGYAEQARAQRIKADNLQKHLDDANAALIAASEDRLMAQTLSRALDNAIADNRRLRATTEEQP